jgi:hypothetical protein
VRPRLAGPRTRSNSAAIGAGPRRLRALVSAGLVGTTIPGRCRSPLVSQRITVRYPGGAMLSAPLNRHNPRTKYITVRSGRSRHRRFPVVAEPTTSSTSATGTCFVSTPSRSGNPCSADEGRPARVDDETTADLGGKVADSGIEAPGKDGLILVDLRPTGSFTPSGKGAPAPASKTLTTSASYSL